MKKWKDDKNASEPQEAAGAQLDAAAPAESDAGAPAEDAPDYQAICLEKDKQITELIDRLQRSLAEFDNFRKRTIKEKSSMYDDGVKDAFEKLLPVFDNLERALFMSEVKDGNLYKGIEMTFRQLGEIMAKMGVESLPGVGEQFDPNWHHAVAHIEDKSLGDNVIVEELQKGYKYKDKPLRPSMVKVAN
ncbi:MAG: nucleotide exchange factor GrpE [Clostridiales bacterium]|nr:nucleotide exchange factor GrpE [Clostridiales bacterium]